MKTTDTDVERTVEIVLIRHGESIWNTESRYQGHAGPGLSERGFDQARAAAEVIAERYPTPAFALSSDLPRTVETAAAWVEITGAEISYDPRWREIHVNEWAGLLPEDVEREFPAQLAAVERGEDVARGNGETFAQLRDRIWAVMEETAGRLSREGQDAPALVFTHGGGIRTAATKPLGMVAVQQRWLHAPSNCSITVFRFGMSADHRVVESRLVEYNTTTTAAAAKTLTQAVQ